LKNYLDGSKAFFISSKEHLRRALHSEGGLDWEGLEERGCGQKMLSAVLGMSEIQVWLAYLRNIEANRPFGLLLGPGGQKKHAASSGGVIKIHRCLPLLQPLLQTLIQLAHF
jgi:hypothetical protein